MVSTIMTQILLILAWLLASVGDAVEDGFIMLDDDLNVVISSPEGRVVLNGVDILASMDILVIRWHAATRG